MRRGCVSILLSVIILVAPLGVSAQTTSKNKGLLITPLRALMSLDAGTSKKSTFSVANLTDNPLTIKLFDRQFSVENLTYDYKFSIPRPDIVTIDTSEVLLKPGESQKITYTVNAPKNITPGGQYYTLFASATLVSGEHITVQAATLLYVTINGALHKTNELQASSIQRFSFGKSIRYSLQPLDTGNVHYFIYVSGQLHGLSAKQADEPVTHILLPGVVRAVSGTIRAPLLPGIYKATYGYRTDSGQDATRSAYVAYFPPWSVAFVLLAVLVIWKLLARSHTRKKAPPAQEINTEK